MSQVTADTSIADHLAHVVASAPAAEALTGGGRSYSYAEIDRWSDAVARDIVRRRVSPEPPIAIVTSDIVSLVPAVLGAVKSGCFFIAIDAADPDERIVRILAETRAALCVVDAGKPVPRPLDGMQLVEIAPAPPAGLDPCPPAPPHPLVQIIFTSGSTGKPKAIATPQRGFVADALLSSARIGRVRGERVSYIGVPGFSRATSAIFGTLLSGGTLCAFDARSESLDALAATIARERITVLSITPSLFRGLMAACPEGLDVSSVRRLNVSADVLTVADVEAFKRHFPSSCRLESGFGSTEAGLVFRMNIDHDTPVPGPLVPLGVPWPEVEVRVVDEEGNDAPDGEAGELVVTSAHVIEGYWDAGRIDSARFLEHPSRPGVRTLATGDLVRRGRDGLYYFAGRRDDRLKIHGRRIDPVEVEAALVATGMVRAAAVVGKEDPSGTRRLTAYVVMRDGEAFDARAIRKFLRRAVPSWMVPARIIALSAIPFTGAGKVDRAALTSRRDEEGESSSGPRDALERDLAAIWSRVIGAPVHVDDDFFDDHGGESVVAAQLVTEIQRETGQRMPLSLLLELNSVARMADYLRAGGARADHLAVQVQRGGALPPLFCVSGKGGSVMIFRKLAAAIGPDLPFYGLTHHGFDPAFFPATVATMAAHYIRAMREVAPEGPYYLAGYSGGGAVALEIGRQLERAGEHVPFLGLIDSPGVMQRASMRRRLANRLDMIRQRPLYRAAGFFREAVTRSRAGLKELLARRGLATARPVHEGDRAFRRLKMDDSSRPYGGPVTLFRARNGLGLLGTLPDLGWASRGVSRLEIVDVRGDHVTMLTDDSASLARALSAALDTARRAADADPGLPSQSSAS